MGRTLNNEIGETMATEDTTVSELDIQDVSLLDTPIAPAQDAPSEPADQGTNEAADTEDKPQEDASEANDTEATEQPAQTTEAPKETADQAKARAQMEYQNRQRTRQQVAQQLDQTYGPKSEEQLVEEGLEPAQAQIQALREEMQFERQRTQIAELNAGLQAEAVNVFNDFPVFNPQSKDYDPEFANMVETQYQTAARLQTDESGIVLNAEVPLYDFYQRMNNIYSRGASKGSEQGQQEALQMLARTENVGGSSASGNNSDSLADLEERLGDFVIT
jgi:hypothetical protein